MQKNLIGMILRQPANRWQDALPSGNGTLGALVYGHIRNEIILLNHENLWLRSPKPGFRPVHQHMEELRKLLFEGEYQKAGEFFNQKLKEANPEIKVDPYQPVFDVGIDMETVSTFKHYRRLLDFETGEITVQWQEEQAQFCRKLFVSRADDAVVISIRSENATPFNCKISFFPHDAGKMASMGSGRDISARELPFTYQTGIQDGRLMFEGLHGDGTRFGGLGRVSVKGGTAAFEKASVSVENAEEAVLVIKLFVEEGGTSALERLHRELDDLPCEYEYLLIRHIGLHGELFKRVTLELAPQEGEGLSNEELLMRSYEGDAPEELIQKMFNYGRYLLISSSRPGGLPANLQGVWNGDYIPAWWSDFHNDENIQMNYWQALPGNIPEATLPYFDYYESMLEDFRTNAKEIYNCSGILIPVCQTTHGLVWPDIWAAWTAGAGWLAQLFYDYWLFTGDREFLNNRTIPFLKEIAMFYEDFLLEKDGKLMFVPSLSPENVPLCENASLVSINATMDIAVAKEVLSNLCSACKLLDLEGEGIPVWEEMLKKLPEYEVNKDGALREWLYPGLGDNYSHRHLSHLYPLFPGTEVTEESNPELYLAIKTAVEKRMVVGITSQTGWSLAHMANIYARLGDGSRALECLDLLCRSCVGSNLLTYHNDWRSQGITMFWGHGNHPPFQIDANFGLAAAVMEMLVFSVPGLIKLLPALPNRWLKGKAEGILCRGGVEVSLAWDLEAKSLKAGFKTSRDQVVTVKFPGVTEKITCLNMNEVVFDSELGERYKRIALSHKEPLALFIVFSEFNDILPEKEY